MSILSIQSHVSYGHAGNSSAVFPLQRMGLEVWPVHTVMFSNHTGYNSWKGPIFSSDTVAEVLHGVEQRHAYGQCQAVLSGYLGTAAIGEVILTACDRVKAHNPAALYCCDPVIGDVGRGVFVQPEIPDFFREKALQRADILTPNHFELETLSGQTVRTLEEALAAARVLLGQGPSLILVTSLVREQGKPGMIEMLAVEAEQAWLVATPQLQFSEPVNGSGDVTTAVFLARYLQTGEVKLALEHTANAIFALFERTWAKNSRELQIVAAQNDYVAPTEQFTATAV